MRAAIVGAGGSAPLGRQRPGVARRARDSSTRAAPKRPRQAVGGAAPGSVAGAWPVPARVAGTCWSTRTPVGDASGDVDDRPCDAATLPGDGLVYDLVYNPRPTRLLRDAAAAGCRHLTVSTCSSPRPCPVRAGRRDAGRTLSSSRPQSSGWRRWPPSAEGRSRDARNEDHHVRRVRRAGDQRGTFVPVYKEILADLPDAGVGVPQDCRARRLRLPARERRGRRTGRPLLRSSARIRSSSSARASGQAIIERGGRQTECGRAAVDDAAPVDGRTTSSPVVPGLPRLTGGAVGYFGYDAAPWFEPARRRLGARRARSATDRRSRRSCCSIRCWRSITSGTASCMIANARMTPGDEDLESLYQFACARIAFLERELDRRPVAGDTGARRSAPLDDGVQRRPRESSSGGADGQASTSPPATSIRWCCRSASTSRVDRRPVHRLPRAARTSTRRRTCISSASAGCSLVGSSPEMLVRVEGARVADAPDRRHAAARRDADARTSGSGEELSATRRSAPSTSCSSTSAATTSAASVDYGTVRVPSYMDARALLAT